MRFVFFLFHNLYYVFYHVLLDKSKLIEHFLPPILKVVSFNRKIRNRDHICVRAVCVYTATIKCTFPRLDPIEDKSC